MGGLCVYVKHTICKYVKRIEESCSFSIILQIDKSLTKLETDTLAMFVYLPPNGSPFYDNKIYKNIFLLEDELVSLMCNFENCNTLVMGDLNSRCGELSECLTFDEHVDELNQYNEIFQSPVDETRRSCDKTVNAQGRQLIELCKIYSLYILNGRFGHDKNIGNFTYVSGNGSSVIDYCLCSNEIIQIVKDFKIEERSESKHFPVSVHISCNNISDQRNQSLNDPQIMYKILRSQKDEYSENANLVFSNESINDFSILIDDHTTNINDIISKLVENFKSVGKPFEKCSKKPKRKNPYWFDKECKQAKTFKYRLLRNYRNHRSEGNLQLYLEQKKLFKALCNDKQKEYNKNQLDDLCSKVNNPNSFWSKLKQMTFTQKRSSNTITTEQWIHHFEGLLNPCLANDENTDNIDVTVVEPENEIDEFIFNSEITEDEIRLAIKHMKAGKKSGPDNLIPEFFIYGVDIILPILVKLFNRIFETGEYPDSWTESLIVTLHKKGDVNNTDNYRGISLQNVLSKIYCCVLVYRLNFFTQMYDKISENQGGFKSGYSTVDNAFILKSLIDRMLKRKRGKLYVAFVDFQKCFDTIDRTLLWHILKENGIKGNLFRALKSMYTSVKSYVRCNGALSDPVYSTIGLKQGCLASPILFLFFIDELEKTFHEKGARGIQLHPETIQLFLLMFADDLALIADTVLELQRQLNILSDFCLQYKLKVNEDKTKVVVFKNGGVLSRNEKWHYRNVKLEVVNKFCYLGLLLTRQMSVNAMVHELCTKGKRVLVTLLKQLYSCGQLTKSVFFKLFDTKIAPILLYGAELWGIEKYPDLERVQYYACKRFMCAKQKAPNFAVIGDCSRYPMYIESYKRGIKYWLKITRLPDTRYVKKCYNMMLMDDAQGFVNWVTSIRLCLQRYGFGVVWQNQMVTSDPLFLKQFTNRIKDCFLQDWNATIAENSKLNYYTMFKSNIDFERYLDILDIRKFRYSYVNFRLGCHELEIERGRYRNIPRQNRICTLCAQNSVEDEYHFLLCCEKYSDIRSLYIPNKYYNNPSVHKFNMLMSSKNENIIKATATYLVHAFRERSKQVNPT